MIKITISTVLFFILNYALAGTTPNAVFLDTSITPSQVKPLSNLVLTARRKGGENVLYRFVETKDDVVTLLRDFSFESDFNYTVPSNYKKIVLSVTAKGDGASEETISSKVITFNGDFVFSQDKYYPLENAVVFHPGIIIPNDYKINLIDANGGTTTITGIAIRDGELRFSVPKSLKKLRRSFNSYQINVEGLRTKQRQFISIFNTQGITGKRHFYEKEAIGFRILENLSLDQESYNATLDGNPITLKKIEEKTLMINGLNTEIGEHELNLILGSSTYKFFFNVIESEVISSPYNYINDVITQAESFINSQDTNLPINLRNYFSQGMQDFREKVASLNQEELLIYAKVIHANSLGTQKIMNHKYTGYHEDCVVRMRDALTDKMGGFLSTLGLNLISIPFDEALKKLKELGIFASYASLIDHVNENKYCALVKDSSIDDQLIKLPSRHENGPLTFEFFSNQKELIRFMGKYRNIYKGDSNIADSPPIANEIYTLYKRIDMLGLFLRNLFETTWFITFDIDNVEKETTDYKQIDPKFYKDSGFNQISLNGEATRRIVLSKFITTSDTATVKFSTSLSEKTPFTFSSHYKFPSVTSNHQTIFRTYINPYTCQYNPVEYLIHQNPGGSQGGYVHKYATISNTVTISPGSIVCGEDSVIFGNVSILNNSKVDNSEIISVDDNQVDGITLDRMDVKNSRISGRHMNLKSSTLNQATINGHGHRFDSIIVDDTSIQGNEIILQDGRVAAPIKSTAEVDGTGIFANDTFLIDGMVSGKQIVIIQSAVGASVTGDSIRVDHSQVVVPIISKDLYYFNQYFPGACCRLDKKSWHE